MLQAIITFFLSIFKGCPHEWALAEHFPGNKAVLFCRRCQKFRYQEEVIKRGQIIDGAVNNLSQ